MVGIKISIMAILKSMQHACVLRSRLPFGMLRPVSGICSMRGDYSPHLENQDSTALLARAEASCVKLFFCWCDPCTLYAPKGLAPRVSLGGMPYAVAVRIPNRSAKELMRESDLWDGRPTMEVIIPLLRLSMEGSSSGYHPVSHRQFFSQRPRANVTKEMCGLPNLYHQKHDFFVGIYKYAEPIELQDGLALAPALLIGFLLFGQHIIS